MRVLVYKRTHPNDPDAAVALVAAAVINNPATHGRVWRIDKVTAMGYLRSVIVERSPPRPDRQRWLAWLTEFSRAEEILQSLPGLLISRDDDERPQAR
jgi:hypothetical protein